MLAPRLSRGLKDCWQLLYQSLSNFVQKVLKIIMKKVFPPLINETEDEKEEKEKKKKRRRMRRRK
jgi:hypothetical protein